MSVMRETANLMNLARASWRVLEEEKAEAREEAAMDYKYMNESYYYSATIILFLLEAILAIIIPDIDIVFNFVSAFAVSCLGFLFPSVFFIYAEKKFEINKLVLK